MKTSQSAQNVITESDGKEIEKMRKIAVAVVFLMCMWMLSACNTVHGIGKDVERGGEAIEKSSGK